MNGSSVAALGRGKIRLRCSKGRVLILKDALYVPAAALHLISIGRLCDDGLVATFNSTSCNFKNKNGKMIAGGTRAGKDLYHFNGDPLIVECVNIACTTPNLETWHHHLGHVNYQSVIDMAKKGLTRGMPTDLSTLPEICEHCIVGKQMKTPVPKIREGTRAKYKLEKVYSDITGPEAVTTNTGERYMLNLIDDFTSFSWTYILKKKSDAKAIFKEWKTLVEAEAKSKVGIFRTDSCGECTSVEFETYLCKEGIHHQLTTPHTSAQNGKAEHCHRTIMNRACAIQSNANLPPSLWGKCI